MIRVVLDTNILYSAILQRAGLPAAVFDLVSDGLLIPCVSPAVLAEYHDVLLERPRLRPYAERAHSVLEILAKVAIRVEPTGVVTESRDESDNRFLECAEAADAAYLVTGNIKHFPERYKATKVVTARQLWAIMMAAGREEKQ
ncbi:conserved hypothetical protein [Candidatus Sulfopaludibacter sp. SbA4]|nr:conserved hypothetical protein [Candidatus Sulfopaludibacter sp. SbA4]